MALSLWGEGTLGGCQSLDGDLRRGGPLLGESPGSPHEGGEEDGRHNREEENAEMRSGSRGSEEEGGCRGAGQHLQPLHRPSVKLDLLCTTLSSSPPRLPNADHNEGWNNEPLPAAPLLLPRAAVTGKDTGEVSQGTSL